MNYCLNEYSLRGQFEDIDSFYSSLRKDTLPVLNRIQKEQDSVIWKKDTFWQCKICNEITINNIPHKRNENSPEMTALKSKLIRLYSEGPFWGNNDTPRIEIEKYDFDSHYSENFAQMNCFYNAIENEGIIVSFVHSEYSIDELSVILKIEDDRIQCKINNIFNITWWDRSPIIEHWKIKDKYYVEVRANEFEFHPPHFHVSYNEYEAVFNLSTGELYKHGKNEWNQKMITEIKEWYKENKERLQAAWDNLHK